MIGYYTFITLNGATPGDFGWAQVLPTTAGDDDPDVNEASGGCFEEPELISGCSDDRC